MKNFSILFLLSFGLQGCALVANSIGYNAQIREMNLKGPTYFKGSHTERIANSYTYLTPEKAAEWDKKYTLDDEIIVPIIVAPVVIKGH